MIHVPCTNVIIVLFTLSGPNSHVTFLFYISIRAYITSSLLIMPPLVWGGGGEERGAERQKVEEGGRPQSLLTVCV